MTVLSFSSPPIWSLLRICSRKRQNAGRNEEIKHQETQCKLEIHDCFSKLVQYTQRVVHGQGATNANYSTVVLNFDGYSLS